MIIVDSNYAKGEKLDWAHYNSLIDGGMFFFRVQSPTEPAVEHVVNIRAPNNMDENPQMVNPHPDFLRRPLMNLLAASDGSDPTRSRVKYIAPTPSSGITPYIPLRFLTEMDEHPPSENSDFARFWNTFQVWRAIPLQVNYGNPLALIHSDNDNAYEEAFTRTAETQDIRMTGGPPVRIVTNVWGDTTHVMVQGHNRAEAMRRSTETQDWEVEWNPPDIVNGYRRMEKLSSINYDSLLNGGWFFFQRKNTREMQLVQVQGCGDSDVCVIIDPPECFLQDSLARSYLACVEHGQVSHMNAVVGGGRTLEVPMWSRSLSSSSEGRWKRRFWSYFNVWKASYYGQSVEDQFEERQTKKERASLKARKNVEPDPDTLPDPMAIYERRRDL